MPKLLTDLPADVVQHIVVRLTLAHHIARTAPTCKVVSIAARNAIRVRRFSGEVVTLAVLVHPSLLEQVLALEVRLAQLVLVEINERNGQLERVHRRLLRRRAAEARVPGRRRCAERLVAMAPDSPEMRIDCDCCSAIILV